MQKKSLIYGYGKTGKSFETYLKRKKIEFEIISDVVPKIDNEYENIYCSPGIPREIYLKLKKKFSVFTDIDIFFKEDSSIKIGITGTNRKSTTCYHLYQLLKKDFSVNLIGNIGNPVLDSINNGKKFSIIELSSFQLDKVSKIELDYGVLLNIEPDHLDYHKSFSKYKKTKLRIFEAKETSTKSDPYELYDWIVGKKIKKQALKNLSFRFQKISKNLINDSKSTNSHSLKYAILKAAKYFGTNEYNLILCGDPSKENIKKLELIEPMNIYIYGSYTQQINRCVSHENKFLCSSLKECLNLIKTKKNTNKILFSPGFPSGEDYKNFEDRGKYFNKIHKSVFDDK